MLQKGRWKTSALFVISKQQPQLSIDSRHSIQEMQP
jgi:hypothetical protein